MKEQLVSTEAPWNETGVSSTWGIKYPINQGPVGGLSTQRLTAAVANFGGAEFTTNCSKKTLSALRVTASVDLNDRLCASLPIDKGPRAPAYDAVPNPIAKYAIHAFFRALTLLVLLMLSGAVLQA